MGVVGMGVVAWVVVGWVVAVVEAPLAMEVVVKARAAQ